MALIPDLKLKLSRWSLLLKNGFGRAVSFLGHTLLTAVGILTCVLLYLPEQQRTASEFHNLYSVFTGVGVMIGTILALVFSLSIIATQRAAEIFSPSITRLYVQDRTTQISLIFMAVFSLLSFVFTVDNIILGLKSSFFLPIEALFIGATFDLLRLHYRHVGNLLDPKEAIRRLTSSTFKKIDQAQKVLINIEPSRPHFLESSGRRKRGISLLHRPLHTFHAEIKDCIGEFLEIALKAIARGETIVAGLAVAALADVACRHIENKKNSVITPYQDPEGSLKVFNYDLGKVLTDTYEALLKIDLRAVAAQDEITGIELVRAFEQIAIRIANEQSASYEQLASSTLYYLGECAKSGQANKMYDITLSVSSALQRITEAAPDAVPSGTLDPSIRKRGRYLVYAYS